MFMSAKQKRSDFLIVGHRGIPRLAQENSESGFRKAVELGIPMVEIDIRITKDGEFAVIHDNDIKHLSDGKGKVHDSNFRFLRQFDYGTSFNKLNCYERLLHLDEALSILLPKVQVMIELKDNKKRRKKIAHELVNILKRRSELLSRIVICSFSAQLLLEVQKLRPQYKLGLIFRTKPKKHFRLALKHGFNSIHPHYRVAKKKLIHWAKDAGMDIFIWTVNSLKSMEKWRKTGVKGIITDIPEKTIQHS